jgi:hypothetical protein
MLFEFSWEPATGRVVLWLHPRDCLTRISDFARGMRVNAPGGVKTLVSFGPKIRKSVEARPEGLLLHENLLFSLFPPHAGMRTGEPDHLARRADQETSPIHRDLVRVEPSFCIPHRA